MYNIKLEMICMEAGVVTQDFKSLEEEQMVYAVDKRDHHHKRA